MPNPAESIGNGKGQEVEPTMSRELPSLAFFRSLPNIKDWYSTRTRIWEDEILLDGQKTKIMYYSPADLRDNPDNPSCLLNITRGDSYEDWGLTEYPEYLSIRLRKVQIPGLLVSQKSTRVYEAESIRLYYKGNKETPGRITADEIDAEKSDFEYDKKRDERVLHSKMFVFDPDYSIEEIVDGLAAVVEVIKKSLPQDPNSPQNFPTS